MDSRVATRIIAGREQGFNHITQRYRYNGTPDHGISILLLWGEAVLCGCTSPCDDAQARTGTHGERSSDRPHGV